MMDLVNLATIAGGAVAVLAFLFACVKFIVQPIRRILAQSEDFREDWYGQPARPGRQSEAGVMERIKNIEAEFAPDHGSSLRDAVDRVEGNLTRHMSDGHGAA